MEVRAGLMSTTTSLSTKLDCEQRQTNRQDKRYYFQVKKHVETGYQDVALGPSVINSKRHFSATHLRQGGRHGSFSSHAVANENAFLNAQLSQEMFQVFSHGFICQHWAVRAVAMITGIYSQHLTGQRIVRALGME